MGEKHMRMFLNDVWNIFVGTLGRIWIIVGEKAEWKKAGGVKLDKMHSFNKIL